MVERNLEHNVGCAAGELQDFPVYSLATCEQMVLNLLCRPVHEKNGRDSLYRFLSDRYPAQIYQDHLYYTGI